MKGIKNKDNLVIIRCDGDSEVGLGHVYRCLSLADELENVGSFNVVFAITRGESGVELIEHADYDFEYKEKNVDEETWLDMLVKKYSSDVLVLDMRSVLLCRAVEMWRSRGILVVTIDDLSDRRLASDVAFYPPIPQVKKIDWSGFSGELKIGWEWVILREEFSRCRKKKNNDSLQVLVTMGGSDPAGMTLKAIKALDSLKADFRTVVVIGKGFIYQKQLEETLKNSSRVFKVVYNTENISDIMADSDLAIASFGVTAYELAAMGVPAIYLCFTDDHRKSARIFEDSGMAFCMGIHDHVKTEELASCVRLVLNDNAMRLDMKEKTRNRIDGKGARRISELIHDRLRIKNGQIKKVA